MKLPGAIITPGIARFSSIGTPVLSNVRSWKVPVLPDR